MTFFNTQVLILINVSSLITKLHKQKTNTISTFHFNFELVGITKNKKKKTNQTCFDIISHQKTNKKKQKTKNIQRTCEIFITLIEKICLIVNIINTIVDTVNIHIQTLVKYFHANPKPTKSVFQRHESTND